MKRTIYINQDNRHFYDLNDAAQMTKQGLQSLVDFYARNSQVKAIMFCANVQRALFDSQVWENFFQGDAKQLEKRGHGATNIKLLYERELNHFKIWLERCKYHKIQGFISMRMNDCHGLEESAFNLKDVPEWCEYWPSKFWLDNKQLRRAPYRPERSFEGAFNYSKKAVREHHLKFIKEIFERFDMCGFEMDWMRWPLIFAPGEEHQGKQIITDFIGEVKQIATFAEKRVNHKIILAHRVPADLQSCINAGYDVIAWAKKDLAQICTLSSFLCCANFEYNIELWKAVIGNKIKLITHVEGFVQPYATAETILCYDFLLGAAQEALKRGADGVYLFNECYRQSDNPKLLRYVLENAGGLKTLEQKNKRYALSYAQFHLPGESPRDVLPIPFTLSRKGSDMGRLDENISLRIPCGEIAPKGKYFLRLGFSEKLKAQAINSLKLRINTNIIKLIEKDFVDLFEFTDFYKKENFNYNMPLEIQSCAVYQIETRFLKENVNVVEFVPPQIECSLLWAEIIYRA